MNAQKILSRALEREGIDAFLKNLSLRINSTPEELIKKIVNKKETTIDDVEKFALELDIDTNDYLEYFFCS